MKMKNFGFKDVFIIALFVIFGFISPLEGGSGGGSGYSVTPYEYEDEIIEAAENCPVEIINGRLFHFPLW